MDFIKKLKDIPEMLNEAADSMKDTSSKINNVADSMKDASDKLTKAMTGESKKKPKDFMQTITKGLKKKL
ncbi:hypothetical protein ROHU_029679 [Labeo rohita]|uniref:Uncharacterized protein n=1 Tax=Labeo rohita TaxID=84645 RepID=A0A498LYT8_LABRO|nr:hypothetical protein ROHU_029679 [Labeo rohita]